MQAPRQAPVRTRGLVLLEVLAAVCVLAVLAALAVPSVSAVSERLKLNTAVDALTSSLYAARAEAYRRGGHVTLAQGSSAPCEPAVQGRSRWHCGWTLFTDADENGNRDPSDELIRVEQPPPGIDIEQTGDLAALRLNAWGQFHGQRGVGFILRSRAREDIVTAICISSAGRIRSLPGESKCA